MKKKWSLVFVVIIMSHDIIIRLRQKELAEKSNLSFHFDFYFLHWYWWVPLLASSTRWWRSVNQNYNTTYSSISNNISLIHLAFEKKNIPSKTAYHVTPIYEKKNFCPRRSYHVLPIYEKKKFCPRCSYQSSTTAVLR